MVQARNMWFVGTPSPCEAEANSLRQTLIWLHGKEKLHIELQTLTWLQGKEEFHVELETDCKQIVDSDIPVICLLSDAFYK